MWILLPGLSFLRLGLTGRIFSKMTNLDPS